MPRLTAIALPTLALPALAFALATTQAKPTSAAIDADVWTPLAASAASADIVAMAKVYHPDAVLVSESGTQSIRSVLPRWGKDFADNKKRGATSAVELRFTTRQDDAETAYEIGAFKFTVTERDGTKKPGWRRFETLLVKREGKWRVLMERQREAITEAEWNRIPSR